MAIAAPLFYGSVVDTIELALFVATLLVEALAFVHCLIQRSDAFPAIGTMSKGVWLGLTGAAVLITALGPLLRMGPISLFALIAITIGLIYILDIRPALRDAIGGHGPW